MIYVKNNKVETMQHTIKDVSNIQQFKKTLIGRDDTSYIFPFNNSIQSDVDYTVINNEMINIGISSPVGTIDIELLIDGVVKQTKPVDTYKRTSFNVPDITPDNIITFNFIKRNQNHSSNIIQIKDKSVNNSVNLTILDEYDLNQDLNADIIFSDNVSNIDIIVNDVLVKNIFVEEFTENIVSEILTNIDQNSVLLFHFKTRVSIEETIKIELNNPYNDIVRQTEFTIITLEPNNVEFLVESNVEYNRVDLYVNNILIKTENLTTNSTIFTLNEYDLAMVHPYGVQYNHNYSNWGDEYGKIPVEYATKESNIHLAYVKIFNSNKSYIPNNVVYAYDLGYSIEISIDPSSIYNDDSDTDIIETTWEDSKNGFMQLSVDLSNKNIRINKYDVPILKMEGAVNRNHIIGYLQMGDSYNKDFKLPIADVYVEPYGIQKFRFYYKDEFYPYIIYNISNTLEIEHVPADPVDPADPAGDGLHLYEFIIPAINDITVQVLAPVGKNFNVQESSEVGNLYYGGSGTGSDGSSIMVPDVLVSVLMVLDEDTNQLFIASYVSNTSKSIKKFEMEPPYTAENTCNFYSDKQFFMLMGGVKEPDVNDFASMNFMELNKINMIDVITFETVGISVCPEDITNGNVETDRISQIEADQNFLNMVSDVGFTNVYLDFTNTAQISTPIYS